MIQFLIYSLAIILVILGASILLKKNWKRRNKFGSDDEDPPLGI